MFQQKFYSKNYYQYVKKFVDTCLFTNAELVQKISKLIEKWSNIHKMMLSKEKSKSTILFRALIKRVITLINGKCKQNIYKIYNFE